MTATWGVSATIKAPVDEILNWAAYHLEQGAHRLLIYFDDDNHAAHDALRAHPKCLVTLCDESWWQKRKGQRPEMHQQRQTVNATHAYRNAREVDWLIHMDVDEFLVADRPIAEILAEIPSDQPTARVRPMEQLSGNPTLFKAFIPPGRDRSRLAAELYPTFGEYLKGGFLSHLAGKVFVHTGLERIHVRIHNVFQAGEMVETPERQPGIDLAHLHAKSWEDWLSAYRFRFERGSYRADLAPNKPQEKGGLSMHELFSMIEAEGGEAGLRAFFDEVCADSPDLRGKLRERGLLRHVNLGLKATIEEHFPHHTR
ncbi:MAG: glycosyltransferase family 2 protein [Sulfitobacter sp.]|nr:glycosyltransferase family 2 protein [Sulfitobacter sp.]